MSPLPIRTLIVEDQSLFRSFLEVWLLGQSDFILVGSASSGEEALGLVQSAEPDLALVDLQLPGIDGLGFVKAARQVRPHLRALVLSALTDPLALTRVHESGVEGYIEKDVSPVELSEALHAVAAGRPSYSAKFREMLAREKAKGSGLGKILSRREQEILSHILMGKTNREMSELIKLSPRTIEFHRANVMTKLGATNAAELAAKADLYDLGLFTISRPAGLPP